MREVDAPRARDLTRAAWVFGRAGRARPWGVLHLAVAPQVARAAVFACRFAVDVSEGALPEPCLPPMRELRATMRKIAVMNALACCAVHAAFSVGR